MTLSFLGCAAQECFDGNARYGTWHEQFNVALDEHPVDTDPGYMPGWLDGAIDVVDLLCACVALSEALHGAWQFRTRRVPVSRELWTDDLGWAFAAGEQLKPGITVDTAWDHWIAGEDIWQ